VTHDQEEAFTIADYIAVMHNGRISQLGKSYDIYDHPTSIMVADFIGKANFVETEIIAQEAGAYHVKVNDATIRVNCAQGEPTCFNTGKKAVLFFRPEKAYLSTEAIPQKSIGGVVINILYLGEAVRYTIRLATGEEVNISLNRRIEGLSEGSDGYLVLEPDDGILFPIEQKTLLNRGN
jgi:ABC-type Fe3+/spermidine/putrescine transport system ATPase subunit